MLRTTSLTPPWLLIARQSIGERETLGPNDSPYIRRMLAALNGMWLRGQPWCGSAVAYWMQQAGIEYPKAYYRAKSWLDWGHQVPPHQGCVVIFERQGGGHVGLLEGKTASGNLAVLGANQRDAVNVMPFGTSRVLGYRWPVWQLNRLPLGELPVVALDGPLSTDEA